MIADKILFIVLIIFIAFVLFFLSIRFTIWFFQPKVTRIVKKKYKGNYAEYSNVDPVYEMMQISKDRAKQAWIEQKVGNAFTLGKLNFDKEIKSLHRIFLFVIIFLTSINILVTFAILYYFLR